MIIQVALAWVGGILNWILHVQRIKIDIDHEIEFGHQQWNLIVANHQSWFDIFALLYLTHRKLPILKFFIKKQLFWVPIAGAAWWALDYPFMERYSKSYLEKHPEKAGQDLETTKRSCEKFSEQPTTIVNFLEGTRFTQAKHRAQQSPYMHLLKPKAGGIAFAIQALGKKFNTILDATIHYQGQAPSYWNMACGRVSKVTLQVKKRDIPSQFLSMDYTNNTEDRKAFQNWVTQLWETKDKALSVIDTKNR
jgi:1-acyl-sn-glycerol-3-phosphate acyltransferase